MKKAKIEETLFEELGKTPIVSAACNKLGISRQTYYRWFGYDKKFRKRAEGAIECGIESLNDLAESKLAGLLKQGDLKAIKFWLSHNKANYRHPTPHSVLEKIASINEISEIKINIVNDKKDLKRLEDDD